MSSLERAPPSPMHSSWAKGVVIGDSGGEGGVPDIGVEGLGEALETGEDIMDE